MAIFNTFKKKVMSAVNLSSDNIKMALLQSGYTPDIDAHHNFSDVSNEVSGSGYTAGGQLLTGKTFLTDDTNDKGRFDCSDVVWSSSVISSARYALLYKSGATAGSSPLISYQDFGSDKSTNNTEFKVEVDASGLIVTS